MYLLVLWISLWNALVAFFCTKRLGIQGLFIIYIVFLTIQFVSVLYVFYEVVIQDTIFILKLFDWINVHKIQYSIEFIFDPLSVIMMFVVVTISICVQLYSFEYMSKDPNLGKFMGLLSLFTFFMLFLIASGNMLQTFIGWEGVGVLSYLLINFWNTREAANKAAMKAIIMNKIGDIAFILSLVLLSSIIYTVDWSLLTIARSFTGMDSVDRWVIVNQYIVINIESYSLILFLIIIGACAKSAQIGLHTWLPDAMEGPTPVSALIHAATMVTAGVFLLLRSVHLLKYDELSLLLLSFIGGVTSFIAASIGLFQYDIKKVIAYSTCSQLGYMILSCGLNNYSGSLYHLMNHAFFKALLFLSAGAIIHSMSNYQDIRRMGMLLRYLPISYIMLLVGSLTIMGIPFLTGFYSKDFLLEYIYVSNMYFSFFLYWLGIFSAGLTSIYSIKLLYITFYNTHNSFLNVIYNKKTDNFIIHESGIKIILALGVLFLGSIFIGFLFKDLFLGMGTDIWTNTLDTESYKDILKGFEVEFIPIRIKLIPVIFTIISGLFSFLFFKFYILVLEYFYFFYYYLQLSWDKIKVKVLKLLKIEYKSNKKIRKFETFTNKIFKIKKILYKGYYFSEIYNYFLYKNKKLSYILFKDLDKGFIDFIGNFGIVNKINKILYLFSKKNKNRIDYIVFVMVLSIFIINFILIFWNVISDYKILGILILVIILEIKNNWKNK